MAFFDEDNLPAPPEEAPRRGRSPVWSGEPSNVLPGPLGLGLLVGQSGQAFVAISGTQACATGFGLEVLVKWRQAHRPEGLRRGFRGQQLSDPDAMRFEIRFSDGRVARGFGRSTENIGDDPKAPRLVPQHGGGSDSRWVQRFWVWPLPPAGPITFICQWPALGIPETTTVIDAGVIIEAASQAVEVWPLDNGHSDG